MWDGVNRPSVSGLTIGRITVQYGYADEGKAITLVDVVSPDTLEVVGEMRPGDSESRAEGR